MSSEPSKKADGWSKSGALFVRDLFENS
jgi:hypothetical protein